MDKSAHVENVVTQISISQCCCDIWYPTQLCLKYQQIHQIKVLHIFGQNPYTVQSYTLCNILIPKKNFFYEILYQEGYEISILHSMS
jgi:hypothetical protein